MISVFDSVPNGAMICDPGVPEIEIKFFQVLGETFVRGWEFFTQYFRKWQIGSGGRHVSFGSTREGNFKNMQAL